MAAEAAAAPPNAPAKTTGAELPAAKTAASVRRSKSYTASSGAEYEDSELESRGRTSKWKLVQGLSSSSELTPGALQKIPDSEPSWPIQKSL